MTLHKKSPDEINKIIAPRRSNMNTEESFKLILGDCLEQLKPMRANSVDAVITDPPYGLSFMGKKWDYEVPGKDIWAEVFRVLKPGGHLLSFGGTRTYHRLVLNIEDAGFEIRDQIQWIYGSGFPKSQNVALAIDKQAGAIGHRGKAFRTAGAGDRDDIQNKNGVEGMSYSEPTTVEAKQWQGFGTALKPANEPIALARKPLSEKTVAKNVLKHGTGALNIDGSRIPTEDKLTGSGSACLKFGDQNSRPYQKDFVPLGCNQNPQGRWPANVLFDEEAAAMLDEQSGVLKSGALNAGHKQGVGKTSMLSSNTTKEIFRDYGNDSGGASRFFQVIKQTEFDIESAWQNQSDSLSARPAKSSSKQDEESLNIVREAVRTSCKSDHQLLLCLDSIPSSKKCILYQDLALHVEELRNIGITEITQSLLRLFGSALHATDENTNSENLNVKSGPTRFLYQAKASKRERNAGLEGMPLVEGKTMGERAPDKSGSSNNTTGQVPARNQNFHPTVKPIKLMEYLCKLITPPGGVILDPFMGSGSTGVAAAKLGFRFIGIEMNEEYLAIAQKRIEHVGKEPA